jgi:hypothetical protein
MTPELKAFFALHAPAGSATPAISGFLAVLHALATDPAIRAQLTSLIADLVAGKITPADFQSGFGLISQLIQALLGQTPAPAVVPPLAPPAA